jgi:rhamnogalacturonan endolyase
MTRLIQTWRPWLGALLAALPVAAQLSFEAETVVVNQEALLKDKFSETHWNLWSTDANKEAKWSGGVTLQSPVVKADRATSEEGAPALHLRLGDIPKGIYSISFAPNRVLGISRDGKEWQRYQGRGAAFANVEIAAGTFEFWVDDRFAMPTPETCGSAYLDVIHLDRVTTLLDGIQNADFEQVDAVGLPQRWAWWSREEGKGKAESVQADKHAGERCVRLTHSGEKDWAYTHGNRYPVLPGSDFCLRAWVKGTPVNVCAAGYKDGQLVSWELGLARAAGATAVWTPVQAYFSVPPSVNELVVRVTGGGLTDSYVDDISIVAEKLEIPPRAKVTGWATERPLEPLDRGLLAQRRADGSVYLSWRLLKTDPADIAFDVYRSLGPAEPQKLTANPVTVTTDFMDEKAPATTPTYSVRPVNAPGALAGSALALERLNGEAAYVRLKLQDPETRFARVGIADLNGDGTPDYVIKHPDGNVDPYVKYWLKSTDTYKLEAYLADGTFLWRHDLGWAIEQGVWYSPYIVYDLNGDGRAEVAAKIGEGDPRDADGRVSTGPESLVVWDGMTGAEIVRVPWPAREGFADYNLFSRNQIAVAYLDGKTPCLLALRGTYSFMRAEAYQLADGKLQPLWQYDNAALGREYRGQGAHFCVCADVDSDGRDEVILGSVVLDDDGAPLWTTGRGHPDAAYLSDVDPSKPGMEIAYVMETAQKNGGGLNLVNAATGKTYWSLDVPTEHVHGKGFCADIDPTVAGMEVYGADSSGDHKLTEQRWLFAAAGTLLGSGKDASYGFGLSTLYWDADLQREIAGGKISDYQGGVVSEAIRGSRVTTADVLGDWREEIIVSEKGELRLYSTTVPAMDRRVCLLQDPVYRSCIAMNSMGYSQDPTLSYLPEALSHNLNLTQMNKGADPACRVVVCAPLAAGLKGKVELQAPVGLRLDPTEFAVDLKAGERLVAWATVTREAPAAASATLHAVLTAADCRLTGQVTVTTASPFLKADGLVQAEAFTEQSGGEVHVRDDKAGTLGKAFSHWDKAGHTLGWTLNAPKAGRYKLTVRYCTPVGANRAVAVDGKALGTAVLPSTGGFGEMAFDWEHATLTVDGAVLVLDLTPGMHRLTLENTDNRGCNLDYLALLPVE